MWIVIATAIGVFCGNKFLCDAARVAPLCRPRPGGRVIVVCACGRMAQGDQTALAGRRARRWLASKRMKPFTMSQITSYLFSNDHEMVEMKNNQKSLQHADANLGDEASESENVSDLWASYVLGRLVVLNVTRSSSSSSKVPGSHSRCIPTSPVSVFSTRFLHILG
jgi:hypothetical protein